MNPKNIASTHISVDEETVPNRAALWLCRKERVCWAEQRAGAKHSHICTDVRKAGSIKG